MNRVDLTAKARAGRCTRFGVVDLQPFLSNAQVVYCPFGPYAGVDLIDGSQTNPNCGVSTATSPQDHLGYASNNNVLPYWEGFDRYQA